MRRFFLIIITIFVIGFIGFGNCYGLKTYYDNKQGYDNTTGYDNKIHYKSFFNGNRPETKKIKIQDGKKQTIVTVHEKEEEIKQKGLED